MSTLRGYGWAVLAATLTVALAPIGCGMQGVPMPPSLNLPDRVTDLAAARSGNQVSLTWTMPQKNTDKLLLKGNVTVRVCRREGAGNCTPAGADLQLAPGAAAAFSETLPQALASGAPRALTYFVELRNRKGRSAGLSNGAAALAGDAPAPVAGLAAEVRKDGVALRWKPDTAALQESAQTAVRLHRKLLTSPVAKSQPGLLEPPPEPLERSLLVASGAPSEVGRVPDRALDQEVRFGQVYEYRAQRVVRLVEGGKPLELAGELSPPVRVEVINVFPPAVPAGLAAVATVGENGAETAIDLSWQPDTEAGLAGYIVYRCEGNGSNGTWQRISPAPPAVAPAFHDVQVRPGHTYRYAVSAIGQNGHESVRSAEAQETVPNP